LFGGSISKSEDNRCDLFLPSGKKVEPEQITNAVGKKGVFDPGRLVPAKSMSLAALARAAKGGEEDEP